MESELNEILKNLLGQHCGKNINHRGCVVFDDYEVVAESIENFEVRDDDIWVCSFPKSGTTWVQEMVWTIANDLDFESAKVPIDKRFRWLELPGTLPKWFEAENIKELYKSNPLGPRLGYIESITKLPSPRYFKTHLPFHLLPRQLRERQKKSKIVYISRNPKDTCISKYYFYKLILGCSCKFDDFCKLFLGDKVIFAPYWNHLNSFMHRNDDSNILCLKFEDLKHDLQSVIRRVAIFLNKTLNDEQINRLENHLSFTSMKENPAVNYESTVAQIRKVFGQSFEAKEKFMRSGEVDQWKTVMSEEMITKFDNWIKENSDDNFSNNN